MKWQKLMAKMESCSGFKLESEFERFDRSYLVFHANYYQLIQFVKYYSDPARALELINPYDHRPYDAFLTEATRHLVNFTGSAMMLVDHTRNRLKALYEGTSRDWFRGKVKKRTDSDFRNWSLHRFIQGLRNYSFHRDLPIVAGTLSLVSGPIDKSSHSIQLSTGKMQDWDEWDSLSKKFMAELPEGKIALSELADQYYTRVKEFNEWRKSKQMDLHRKELLELTHLRLQVRKAMEQDGMEVPPLQHRLLIPPEEPR